MENRYLIRTDTARLLADKVTPDFISKISYGSSLERIRKRPWSTYIYSSELNSSFGPNRMVRAFSMIAALITPALSVES